MNFYATQQAHCEKLRDLLADANVSVSTMLTYAKEGDIKGIQDYVSMKQGDNSLLELFKFLNNEIEKLEPSSEIGEMLINA